MMKRRYAEQRLDSGYASTLAVNRGRESLRFADKRDLAESRTTAVRLSRFPLF